MKGDRRGSIQETTFLACKAQEAGIASASSTAAQHNCHVLLTQQVDLALSENMRNVEDDKDLHEALVSS